MGSVTFNPGDRVISIKDNEIRKGVVRKDFRFVNPPVLLVEFEGGNCEKMPYNKVAIDTTPESDVNEPEEFERIEKSEITITPDEFQNITSNAVAEALSDSTPELALPIMQLGAFILATIHEALFGVEPGDD